VRTDGTDPERQGPDVRSGFRDWLEQMDAPRVIEVGTRRSNPDHPTHHQAWAGADAEYLMVDAVPGDDVDLVADAHSLHGALVRSGAVVHWQDAFQAIICVSTLEHLARPWAALEDWALCLRPGGMVYLQTHQTFPEHGYPDDFWRFTRGALELLLMDAGFTRVRSCYEHPCTITPHRSVIEWNPGAPAWLTVCAIGAIA
jgi:hypothetical protein